MQMPVYTPEESLTRETFLALMWALSHPGRVQNLPGGPVPPLHAIGATVLDLETSFYTPDSSLREALARSGARFLEPDRAAYHFYPQLTDDVLTTIKFASTGTMLYPDQSATLVIGCTLGVGQTWQLTGPGIQGTTQIQVGGLSEAFWPMRERAGRYPLGWDIFLVDGFQVVGLPRTTQMSQKG
jgi:alpha-D-ribose 1-methylphosphonate 5-triphosphate synthase subunit PhnH